MDGKSDITNTKAYNLLVSLHDDHTIDDEAFKKYHESLKKIQECLVYYMEYEKLANKRLNELNDENAKTLNDYATLQLQQNELTGKIEKQTEEKEKLKTELSEYENTKALNSQNEIDRNKEEIARLEEENRKKEEDQTRLFQEEIDKLQEKNNKTTDEISKIKTMIEKEEERLQEGKSLIKKSELDIQKKLKAIDEAKDTISFKKNEHDNESKTNDQNTQALQKVEKEIVQFKNDLANNTDQNNKLKSSIKATEKSIEDLTKQKDTLILSKHNAETEFEEKKKKLEQIENQIKNGFEKKSKLEAQKKKLQNESDKRKDEIKLLKMKVEKSSRLITTQESKLGSENALLQEEKTKQEKENALYIKLCDLLTNIEKQIGSVDSQTKDKKDKSEIKDKLKKNCEEKKDDLGTNFKELQNVEQTILKKADQARERIEEIKAKKESIMRTKERLDEETSLINEEIQIKELIFLDMTKKYEELRHMYQKYNVLYKTVLGERNKNVVKIQNSNQNMAELKEKMKILTTEMDILDSELSEIYNKIMDKDKDLNKMSTKKNSLKGEISAFGLKNLKFKEEITKLTNENEKLHSIINSIENEMVSFRVDYEYACESRNYTGIQLIDRNDELCIFYEKIHHIETRINDLYKLILEKEAVVKRSAVEVKEIERFIEVNRKKIPEIPDLSNKIKELDTELKILNQTLEKLIKYVENPENNLKYELPGEDPDSHYLTLKYDKLTEMLNKKKEKLLEKELINDEINEIAEKLRKKALEDRGKNLKISKEMNEYEIKLNDITRKNIASTSELSMFQAILTKLESTKKEKEDNYVELQKRYDNNLAPPQEWLMSYQSMETVKKGRMEYIKNRLEEVHEKENIVIGEIPLRKRPEKRVEEYEDPKTGLPSCVYGKFAPFVPYNDPNNMRHLKVMQSNLQKPEENKEKDRVVQL